ncbi:MAG: epoxyqueuosine reductase QueH [Clostridiales bacterium]|nr:epoxyqueuosine reductase QueH [Candidatus Crickella caballi]
MKERALETCAVNSFVHSDEISEFANVFPEQEKPKVLLHACCGPCSTSCVERLAEDYSVTLYYYNPNITDREEYLLRKETLLQFIKLFNEEHKDRYCVGFIEGPYEPEKFLDRTAALADEPEGGRRCDVCFAMRITDTAKKARELEMDYFTTTMSVSPHKNYEKIKTLGLILEDEYGVKYLDVDFKKKNGFGRSVEMSRQYGLYRQNFCGCDYARYADSK